MKTSPKRKFDAAMVLVLLVGFILGMILVASHRNFVIFIFFGWALFGVWLLFSIKCPNCGKPVAYKGRIKSIPIFAGYSNSRCQNCDFDLNKNE
jgi:hypothetical protein